MNDSLKKELTIKADHPLLVEQFKSLQAETQLRIGEYHKLLFFKMASCGALLSYALAVNSPSVHSSLLAPLIAVMVDFLIVNNLCLIGVMGTYILDEIEKPSLFRGWETFSGETHFDGAKPVTWLTDWAVVIGSTLVIYVLAAAVLHKFNHLKLSLSFYLGSAFFIALFVGDLYYSMSTLNIFSEWKRLRTSKRPQRK